MQSLIEASIDVAHDGTPDQRVRLVRRRVEEAAGEAERLERDLPRYLEWRQVREATQAALAALEQAVRALPPTSGAHDPLPVHRLGELGLEVDLSLRRLSYEGRPVELTRMEFALLVGLARDPRRVFTKQQLLRDVWAYRAMGRTRTLDSHASRLRRKLVAAGAPPRTFVVALWGVGYSLTRPT